MIGTSIARNLAVNALMGSTRLRETGTSAGPPGAQKACCMSMTTSAVALGSRRSNQWTRPRRAMIRSMISCRIITLCISTSKRQAIRENPEHARLAAHDIFPGVPNARLELDIIARLQDNSLGIDLIADCPGNDVAELLARVGHHRPPRGGPSRQDADPRFEDAGKEMAVEVLEREPHLRVLDGLAQGGTYHDHRLRRVAIASNEKSQIFFQGMRQIDRRHQTRPEAPVLDLADRTAWNARQLCKPRDRETTPHPQLAQSIAHSLGVVIGPYRDGRARFGASL